MIHDPLSLGTAQFRRVIGISAYLLAHAMLHPVSLPPPSPFAFFLDGFARRLHAVTMFALRIKAVQSSLRLTFGVASPVKGRTGNAARERVPFHTVRTANGFK